jgi:hypothetical protein
LEKKKKKKNYSVFISPTSSAYLVPGTVLKLRIHRKREKVVERRTFFFLSSPFFRGGSSFTTQQEREPAQQVRVLSTGCIATNGGCE